MNAVVFRVETAPIEMLDAARARTLSLVAGLAPGQWLGPQLDIVNPPLWEVGHLGWFEEHWCLRQGTDLPARLAGADALYDSARVPHQQRWMLPLPDVDHTLQYLAEVRAAVRQRLEQDDAQDYFARLSAFHEEMHCEAFTYTRQTLGYSAPQAVTMPAAGSAWVGDVEITGGRFVLGASDDGSFVFDNEK